MMLEMRDGEQTAKRRKLKKKCIRKAKREKRRTWIVVCKVKGKYKKIERMKTRTWVMKRRIVKGNKIRKLEMWSGGKNGWREM